VLGTDRHGAYRWWPIELWQVCWAHLIRDFIAISERDAHSKRLGEALLLESKQLFKWHDRVRDGTMKRETFRRYVAPLKERVSRILHEGRDHCRNKKTAGTCRAMLKVFSAFWTFVDHEGVDPTNNVSEQRVRHGVIMRKISLGTQSDHGSRFVERILTVHATLRSQRRNVLQFVHAACKAKLQAHPPPSLLPTGTIKS
jgi:transposase